MSDVPLCLCHSCPVECHLPECQLLAYVKELERDKARLDWVGKDMNRFGEVIVQLATPWYDLRLAIDAAMQAMKEGK